MAASKRKPRVYFSFRSPFSWMALRRLSERVGDLDDAFELVPFFEPDAASAQQLADRGGSFLYTPMSKAKHLYILNDTKRLATRLGYQLVWPVDVDPWWELPHLAWIRARREGTQRTLYEAVTRARWERGEDICDHDRLGAVLSDAGLDPGPLLAAPADPTIREEGVEALLKVYRDDVFGVPYFRSGPHKFWGLDRVDDFVEFLEDRPGGLGSLGTGLDQGSPVPQAALAAVGAYDHDTAGGCG